MSLLTLETSQKPLELQQLQARFKEVAQKLLDGTPGMIEAMIEIHKNLQEHEALVEFFSDEDIAILHRAFEKYKGVVLVQKEEKKVSGRKKKLSDNDLANL